MLSITAHNVNLAYYEMLWKMHVLGKLHESRNGAVKRIPGPVVTTYEKPEQRMLFDAKRDANPFFHIFEGIWMLAGRNDVKWISQFNTNIGQFSDTGTTFEGAYGHRWRNHFGDDQLIWVIGHLRKNPTSRRCVLQMYDPVSDQPNTDQNGKDILCNTAIYFDIESGNLNMTVTNRSNDMIWGCYGANAVHMSMLQEFVARALGVAVGRYIQFSNNFHIYERHFDLLIAPEDPFYYSQEMREQHQPLTSQTYWSGDLIQFEQWIDSPYDKYDAPYINLVLNPMLLTWKAYKEGSAVHALHHVLAIKDEAVSVACESWLNRRKWK